MPQCK